MQAIQLFTERTVRNLLGGISNAVLSFSLSSDFAKAACKPIFAEYANGHSKRIKIYRG
jgi:hypothetical protein